MQNKRLVLIIILLFPFALKAQMSNRYKIDLSKWYVMDSVLCDLNSDKIEDKIYSKNVEPNQNGFSNANNY
jgi:hypothetical protein